MLIDAGANVSDYNQEDIDKMLLKKATEKGDLKTVKKLLQSGTPPYILINFGREEEEALHALAREGKFSIFMEFLKYAKDLINKGDYEYDSPPLLYAIFGGNVPAVKALINAGADVNYESSHDGAMPLEWAVNHQYWDIVEILLDANADPKLISKEAQKKLRAIRKTTIQNKKTYREFIKEGEATRRKRKKRRFSHSIQSSGSFGKFQNQIKELTIIGENPNFYSVVAGEYTAFEDRAWLKFLKKKYPHICILERIGHEEGSLDMDFNSLKNSLLKCKREKKRLAIGILIQDEDPDDDVAHSNSIIFDLKNKRVLRFEPHGPYQLFTTEKDIDGIIDANMRELTKKLKKHNIVEKYIPPIKFCPIGPQAKEEYSKFEDLPAEFGYCLAWSLMYLHLKIENPDVPDKKLMQYFDKQPDELKRDIRIYASLIQNEQFRHKRQSGTMSRSHSGKKPHKNPQRQSQKKNKSPKKQSMQIQKSPKKQFQKKNKSPVTTRKRKLNSNNAPTTTKRRRFNFQK